MGRATSRWIKAYFGAYLILWTVSVSAALANACGLGISNLTNGAVPSSWGAVMHSLIGFAFVWFGGFSGFEKVMRALIGLMVVTIVACAALTLQDIPGTISGLFIPIIPEGSTGSLLALIGGVGGTITILNYSYWMREEKIDGPAYLRYVRADLIVAYSVTAILAVAIALLANQAFFVTGVELTSESLVTQMSAMLGTTIGPWAALPIRSASGSGVFIAAGCLAGNPVHVRGFLRDHQEIPARRSGAR